MHYDEIYDLTCLCDFKRDDIIYDIYKFNDNDHIQSRVANTDNNCYTLDSGKVK